MALPADSPFRVVAAAIPQPTSEEDAIDQLSEYITGLTLYNDVGACVLYRNSDDDQDIMEAVYRWDTRPYQEIFETGFSPRSRSPDQSWEDYYDLLKFVNSGGTPADISPAVPSVFVSTTRSSSWKPSVGVDSIRYRYQIFVPGGIEVGLTTPGRIDFPKQHEISFAGGISPQYIRVAREYSVVAGRYSTYTPVDKFHYMNDVFNPNPASDGRTPDEFSRRLRKPTRRRGSEIRIYSAPKKRGTEDCMQNIETRTKAFRSEESHFEPNAGDIDLNELTPGGFYDYLRTMLSGSAEGQEIVGNGPSHGGDMSQHQDVESSVLDLSGVVDAVVNAASTIVISHTKPHPGPLVHVTEVDVQPTTPLVIEETQSHSQEQIFSRSIAERLSARRRTLEASIPWMDASPNMHSGRGQRQQALGSGKNKRKLEF